MVRPKKLQNKNKVLYFFSPNFLLQLLHCYKLCLQRLKTLFAVTDCNKTEFCNKMTVTDCNRILRVLQKFVTFCYAKTLFILSFTYSFLFVTKCNRILIKKNL